MPKVRSHVAESFHSSDRKIRVMGKALRELGYPSLGVYEVLEFCDSKWDGGYINLVKKTDDV